MAEPGFEPKELTPGFVILITVQYSFSGMLSKWSYFNPLKETATMTVAFSCKNPVI